MGCGMSTLEADQGAAAAAAVAAARPRSRCALPGQRRGNNHSAVSTTELLGGEELEEEMYCSPSEAEYCGPFCEWKGRNACESSEVVKEGGMWEEKRGALMVRRKGEAVREEGPGSPSFRFYFESFDSARVVKGNPNDKKKNSDANSDGSESMHSSERSSKLKSSEKKGSRFRALRKKPAGFCNSSATSRISPQA